MMNTFGRRLPKSIRKKMMIMIFWLMIMLFFDGIDPSVKLEQNWSKFREIYKGLTKSYGEVFENHKKSENHDDFINFCGA
jgi:VanZ family protein